eukprot:gene19114-22855_t
MFVDVPGTVLPKKEELNEGDHVAPREIAFQLNKRIVGCESITELEHLVQDRMHTPGQYNSVNVATAFSRLARFRLRNATSRVRGMEGGNAAPKPATLAHLTAITVKHVAHFDFRGLANVVWAVGALKHPLDDLQWLRVLRHLLTLLEQASHSP